MSVPYRPSNGTEGDGFMARFCRRCERERAWRLDERDPCPILTDTMIYDLGDPAYPKEWIVDDDGRRDPRCTAFEEEVSEEVRAHRQAEKDGQAPLFGGEVKK